MKNLIAAISKLKKVLAEQSESLKTIPGTKIYIENFVHPIDPTKDFTLGSDVEWIPAVHFFFPDSSVEEAVQKLSKLTGERFTPEDIRLAAFIENPIRVGLWKKAFEQEAESDGTLPPDFDPTDYYIRLVHALKERKEVFIDQQNLEIVVIGDSF